MRNIDPTQPGTQTLKLLSGWVVALMFAIAGCGTVKNVPTHNIVMMNDEGAPVDPVEAGNRRILSAPALKQAINDQRMEHIIDAIKMKAPRDSAGKQKVLIFIHGGLNSPHGTLKRAKDLTPKIMAAGYYPVFINWESSLLTSYTDHIFFVRQGEYWPRLGPWFFPAYLAGDLVRAVARAPVVWHSQAANFIGAVSKKARRREVNADSAFERYEKEYKSGNSKAIAISKGKDKRGSLSKALAVTVGLATIPTKVLLAPFIDAMGKSSWDIMLRRTRLLFNRDEEYQPNKDEYDEVHGPMDRSNGLGGLSQFMHRLQIEVALCATAWDITLVGHSMGTIVMNETIRRFDEIEYSNLVYMAAACRVSDYEDGAFPYLETHPQTNLYHLTLHPTSDMGEKYDKILPFFDLPPRGSLLVWLDHFLTTPLTRKDRTAGKFNNLVVTLQDTPSDIRDRIRVKAFRAGKQFKDTDPQKHGDFSTSTFWINSFWAP